MASIVVKLSSCPEGLAVSRFVIMLAVSVILAIIEIKHR